jgi:O-antigen/teichoic acid export membrane protein
MIAGHGGRYPWIVAANMIMRFAGFAVLIPMFGLQGAALSTAISLAIITVVLSFLCRRWVGFDPSILILFRRSRGKMVRVGVASLCSQHASPDSK